MLHRFLRLPSFGPLYALYVLASVPRSCALFGRVGSFLSSFSRQMQKYSYCYWAARLWILCFLVSFLASSTNYVLLYSRLGRTNAH
jgi:hypothetical protein